MSNRNNANEAENDLRILLDELEAHQANIDKPLNDEDATVVSQIEAKYKEQTILTHRQSWTDWDDLLTGLMWFVLGAQVSLALTDVTVIIKWKETFIGICMAIIGSFSLIRRRLAKRAKTEVENDIRVLLSQLEAHQENTGEYFEDEDAGIVALIRAKYSRID